MGPKTLPTIWHTYMKLVTKYQISAINSCREKYLGTDRGKTVYPRLGNGGIIIGADKYTEGSPVQASPELTIRLVTMDKVDHPKC